MSNFLRLRSSLKGYIEDLKGKTTVVPTETLIEVLQGLLDEDALPESLEIFGRTFSRDRHFYHSEVFIDSYSYNVGSITFRVIFKSGKWVGRLCFTTNKVFQLFSSELQNSPEEAMLLVQDYLHNIAGHIK